MLLSEPARSLAREAIADAHPDQVNYLNVGLMLGAAGLAFWRPFEVFLFVYAVLGPALAPVAPGRPVKGVRRPQCEA